MVRSAAIAMLVVGALALSACTTSSAPPIVSEDQRVGIRAQLEGQALTLLQAADGSAPSPAYDFGSTIADHDWPAVMTECMLGSGFHVSVHGSTVDYLSGSGQTQAEFAGARYRCTLLHPRVSAVAVYLDHAQLGAIYDYYTRFVVPCLQLAGAHTTQPPERQVFIDRFFAFEWHPFDAVWSTDPGESRSDALENTCSPVPSWLDLGS